MDIILVFYFHTFLYKVVVSNIKGIGLGSWGAGGSRVSFFVKSGKREITLNSLLLVGAGDGGNVGGFWGVFYRLRGGVSPS